LKEHHASRPYRGGPAKRRQDVARDDGLHLKKQKRA